MYDSIPVWFAVPAAVTLWCTYLVLKVRDHAG